MVHVDLRGRAPGWVVGQECIARADDLGFEVCGYVRESRCETRDGEEPTEEGGGEVDVFEVYGDVIFVDVGLLDTLEVGAGAKEGRRGCGVDGGKGERVPICRWCRYR